MAEIAGLAGLRPRPENIATLSAPPYDVIKEGSPLEARLRSNPHSFYHVTLGDDPVQTLNRFREEGLLRDDSEPCFYVYEQTFSGQTRLGFMAAVEVTPYAEKNIIRHEKTFDEKVKGRIEVTRKTGLTLEPIFLLTRASIQSVLEEVTRTVSPEYAFTSDFGGYNDLHGIHNRIFRIPQDSPTGHELASAIRPEPLYIADGHHRYHAALLNGQSHAMAYIVEKAAILAYNRVIKGRKSFAVAREHLALEPVAEFHTPAKHEFCLYTREGAFLLKAKQVPTDVVGRLDCSILEREFYPLLDLDHSLIALKNHFDYYPESDLAAMKSKVDQGEYEIAVALHPVSLEELMAVADAGLGNPEIVMPEKSTFFAPKILSGIMLYQHKPRA